MANMTSFLGNFHVSPDVAYLSAKEKIIWFASHPFVLVILVVIFLFLALLYTVFQNKMDGAGAAFVVTGAFCIAVFAIVFVFFVGLKAGHYTFIERWVASLFHMSGNVTGAANATINATG